MTTYTPPGRDGSIVAVGTRYENWIGGQWVPPVQGRYFEAVTPVTGQAFTEVARSTAEDVELALDAAHGAADDRWRIPAREPAVRQDAFGGVPVAETRMRVPGGDAISRVSGVAGRRRLTMSRVVTLVSACSLSEKTHSWRDLPL